MTFLYREQLREQILASPFSQAWESWLAQNVFQFRLLKKTEKIRVRDDVRILFAEKNWEGCNGLVMTDEIKVTIAGQASLLTIGLNVDCFARVLSILVYPSAFEIPSSRMRDGTIANLPASGLAAYRGPVVVSWESALSEGRDPTAKENVTIHECAHQLDFLDGESNGTPLLASREQEEKWARVMTKAFARLESAIGRGRGTFLGDYAAKSHAEFFAVCSERFFTQPEKLHARYAEVYEVLADYYRTDPRVWFYRRPSFEDTNE